ncbi:MAG: DUF2029 domain-containing protein, partial [Chlorobi bacterium]|nr:DUF2029 domain-containing protein [Chlorobiota bacterium]
MLIRRILIIISILSAVLFLTYSAVKSTKLTNGFASHYTLSRLLLTEGTIEKAYDTTYFNQKINEYGFNNIKDLPNTPTSSFSLLPIAWMEPTPAKMAWVGISVIAVFLSIAALFTAFEINYKSSLGLVLISITFLFYPLYYNSLLGQSYSVMLLFFSAAIYGLKKNNLWLASVSIAFILLYRGYGIIPLLALLLSKKYKEFFAVVFITLVIILVTLPLIHIDSWILFYTRIFSMFGLNEDASNTAYQTIISFLSHLMVFNEFKNPHSLLNIPQTYIYYTVQISGLVAVYFISKGLYKKNIIALFAVSIALNVLFAPIAEDYSNVLYLPLIYLVAKLIYENRKSLKSEQIFFISGVILLATSINFRALQFSDFPIYLLAYPRLYGAILIIT